MKTFLICLTIAMSASAFAETITSGKAAEESFNSLENQFEYKYAAITGKIAIHTVVRHDADQTISCEKETVTINNVVDSVSFKCLAN